MDLDVAGLDDAREAWRAGFMDDVRAASISAMTLGASLEAACWTATGDADVVALSTRWAAKCPSLRIAIAALTTRGALPRPGDHDAPAFELRRCPSREELTDFEIGVEWNYFLDRFRRSLAKTLGLSRKSAWALSAALKEMADNVVEHAGCGDAPAGVVAYEVTATHFGFAVADLGGGALASLRENVVHAGIKTDAEALLSAVMHGASRRPGAGGKGFADLLRALADLEGALSFRSGVARLRLDGRGAGSRVASPSNSPELKGFQLSIRASPSESVW